MGQVIDRPNPHGFKPCGDASAHTSHIPHFILHHPLVTLVVCHCRQITHTVEHRVLLGQVVGKLGQCFGWPKPRTHWKACPLPDAVAHGMPHGRWTSIKMRDRFHPQKAFVDAVDLGVRAELLEDVHHPVANVAIQRVVL